MASPADITPTTTMAITPTPAPVTATVLPPENSFFSRLTTCPSGMLAQAVSIGPEDFHCIAFAATEDKQVTGDPLQHWHDSALLERRVGTATLTRLQKARN